MGYIKVMSEGYILGLAQTDDRTNCTAEEYAQIAEVIGSKPMPPQGHDYRLRTDLTWELTELPPAPVEPTVYTQASLEAMTNAELAEILAAFGISASMNKANMVRLILAVQGGGGV